MLSGAFLGKHPSQFQMNKVVKTFIFSETFLWAAWNFITPIVAVFVTNQINGGSIGVAASAFSTYLIVRVVFELISSKYLSGDNDRRKFIITILGMFFVSLSYISFAFTTTAMQLYLSYSLLGFGIGIASPAKNSLFSTHLDRKKEASEWGIYDASVFLGMAVSAALGGLVAQQFGFQVLFFLAAGINLLGITPYFIFARGYLGKRKILTDALT